MNPNFRESGLLQQQPKLFHYLFLKGWIVYEWPCEIQMWVWEVYKWNSLCDPASLCSAPIGGENVLEGAQKHQWKSKKSWLVHYYFCHRFSNLLYMYIFFTQNKALIIVHVVFLLNYILYSIAIQLLASLFVHLWL